MQERSFERATSGWDALGAALPDGLVVAGPDGAVEVFNDTAARLTRVRAADALGQPFDQVLPLRDAEGREWWKCTDPYGGLATRTRQPTRVLRVGVDGPEVEVTARYVRKERCGPLQQLVLLLRDNSWRTRSDRSRADLVSTVAHELRSPLTTVKGFTATMLTKWDQLGDEQRLAMLRTVDYDADVLTRLIGDLLDVSRIESGRLELHRSLVDVGALAHRLVEGRITAGDDPDRFVVDVQEPLPEAWLDRDKVGQILANLVDNAVRHGGGTITVVVEHSRGTMDMPGPAVAVSVSDEGAGIPAEMVPSVFARFWRGSHRRRGSSGLGLYIVKGLVEAHGGTIALGTSSSGGALFRFLLPVGSMLG